MSGPGPFLSSLSPLARLALVVALLGAVLASVADAEAKVVNLGRLSIARVYASSVNGGRPLDDPFYGARNLFDAGANVVNGISYPYWLSGEPPHWVRVRFQGPVTVDRVVVETGEQGAPTMLQIELRGGSGALLRASGPVAIVRDRTSYDLPRPQKGVRDVLLLFSGLHQIRVHEVAILGEAPRGTPVVEATPAIDVDLGRTLAREAEQRSRDRGARTARLIDVEVDAMRRQSATLRTAHDVRGRAEAWLNLNRSADRVAELLEEMRRVRDAAGEVVGRQPATSGQPVAEKATASGITVYICEIGRNWVAGIEGYQQYLALWPDGPDADEATWMVELRHGPRCGDFEPSVEEYQRLIDDYSRFVARFPGSRFVGEATNRLRDYERALATLRQ